MKKHVIVAIFVIVVLAAGSITLVSAEPKDFKLGFIVPMTGPASHIGRRMKHAFMMAAEEINEKGGLLGMQVKLIEWDGMADPERAMTGAKKLIESDGVWGLIGVFRSGAALAVADVAAAKKKVFVDTNANSPAITALVKKDYNKYKYVFRPAATAIHFSDSVIPFITGIVKAKTYFYIAENTTYARDTFGALEVALKPMGITCVGNAYADVSASEFMGELARINLLNPMWSSSPCRQQQELLFKNSIMTKRWEFRKYPFQV